MVGDNAGSLVPQSVLPTPLIGCESSHDEVIVETTNEAFENTFDSFESAIAFEDWLTEYGVDSSTATDITSLVVNGDRVDTRVLLEGANDATGTRYRLQSLDWPEASLEYCILTEQQPASTVEVDRLASVISHDLRNPLDVATAHLHEARKTGRDEHFDRIAESHDRMARILQDVLTLARGEGALNLSPAVDVGTVASEAWATVDTATADLTVTEDLPTIEADTDRLTRLLENLFRNSVEHARSDTDAPIEVRVGSTGGGFYVADNGVGVPPAEREHVFDPGFTTEMTSTSTGLGLTIVEEISDAHGWTVSLTDSIDGGARFEFHPSTEDMQ